MGENNQKETCKKQNIIQRHKVLFHVIVIVLFIVLLKLTSDWAADNESKYFKNQVMPYYATHPDMLQAEYNDWLKAHGNYNELTELENKFKSK